MSASAGELTAMRDLFDAAPAAARACGTTIDSAVCLAFPPAPRLRELNRVSGLGCDGPVPESLLDRIDGFFAESGCPGYIASISPEAVAAGVPEALRARGFRESYGWMKFTRPTAGAPVVETDLEIAPARDALAWANVVRGAFGMPEPMAAWLARLVGRPGWTCLAAHDDGEPVAAGALYVAGERAWLGLGGTLPAARGRGAQSALLAARLQAAGDQGALVAETETGERTPDRVSQSYRNILRAGFQETFLRPNLASPGFPDDV